MVSDRQAPVWNTIPPEPRFTPRSGLPVMMRLAIAAAIVAVIAGGFALAALAFWIAIMLIPVALLAGLIAAVAIRVQLWRARRSFGGQRYVFRP
ncbi:MAG: hypothetical protein JO209_00145 [Acidisphaera sp.]|nr:hypothetical protein [Acidisphaera sp.]